MTKTKFAILLTSALAFAACTDAPVDPPTTGTDTGVTDTGETDTGETDTGETDTGETDTGETDTGETDTGENDTGENDTGDTDTGDTDTGDTDTGDTDTGELELGSISGTLRDAVGAPVANVDVMVGEELVTTDSNGEFQFSDLEPGEHVVMVVADGWLRYSEAVQVLADTTTPFSTTLTKLADTVSVSMDSGGVAEGPRGATATFPAGSLVDQEGNPVEGIVDVSVTPMDPTNPVDAAGYLPLDATDDSGEETVLVSHGVIDVTATQDGEELDIAEGSEVEVVIPAPAEAEPETQPPTVPVWSFDEEKGIWVQEGTATYNAATHSYDTALPHLSAWNVDVTLTDRTCVRGTVQDAAGNPVGAASVRLTAGDLSSGWGDRTHTAEDGTFCIVAKQGATVTLTATMLDPDSGEELTAQLSDVTAGSAEYSGSLNPVVCSDTSCADVGTIQFADDGPVVGSEVHCSAQCEDSVGYCGSVPYFPGYCTNEENGCTLGIVDACGDSPIASCAGTGIYSAYAISLYDDTHSAPFCAFCEYTGSELPAVCGPVTCEAGQIEVDGVCVQTAADGMRFTLEWLREGHDLDINLKTPSGAIVNYNTNSTNGCTLDLDNTIGGSDLGAAVENVNCQAAGDGFENGTYDVWVHNYSAGNGDADYTLGIYCEERLLASFPETAPAAEPRTGPCHSVTFTDGVCSAVTACTPPVVACDPECADDATCVEGVCVQNPAEGMRFTLDWATAADLDLYVTTPDSTVVSYAATSGAGCELDVDDLDGGTAEAPAVENINCDADVDGFMPGTYTYRVQTAVGVGRFSVELFCNEAAAGAHTGEITAEAPTSDTWTVCYQGAAGCAPGACPEP